MQNRRVSLGAWALKATHTLLLGHVPGSQSRMVQYPPVCERSHWRSPLIEQSVEVVHESPMDFAQLATTSPRATRRIRWRRNMVVMVCAREVTATTG